MPIVIAVTAAIIVAIGALLGLQLPEIRRYMKMRKM